MIRACHLYYIKGYDIKVPGICLAFAASNFDRGRGIMPVKVRWKPLQ